MIWKTTNGLGQEVVWYSEDEYNKINKCLKDIEEFCIVYSDNPDCYQTVYKHILRMIDEGLENG